MDYLSEEVFNDLVESLSDAIEKDDSILPRDYSNENLDRIASYVIAKVTGEGYSLLALTTMLMRYQIKIGITMSEAYAEHRYIVVIPPENNFEP